MHVPVKSGKYRVKYNKNRRKSILYGVNLKFCREKSNKHEIKVKNCVRIENTNKELKI